MAVFLFPDHLNDVRSSLGHAHRSSTSTIMVKAFLKKAFAAIRDEAALLPCKTRSQIPAFSSLFELSQRSHSSGHYRLEVSSALLCACQLTHTIGHLEQRGTDSLAVTTENLVVGFGLGQLSAAAVACASTLGDLITNGVCAVRLAFRIGANVDSTSRPAPGHGGLVGTWSTAVRGLAGDIQPRLQTIQDDLGLPETARIYISAIGRNNCLITGQPTRLRQLEGALDFFENPQDNDGQLIGLWHAPHLYKEADVSRIMRNLSSTLDELPRQCQVMLSPSTGKPIEGQTAKALFAQAVDDVLRACVRLDLLEESILAECTKNRAAKLSLLSFETDQSFFFTIPHSSDYQFTTHDLAGWCLSCKQRSQRKDANIAIIGMSCRFPSADGPEALWDLLEQGQDTCKQVPRDRFDIKTHWDPDGKKINASHTPYGCFIEQPGLFDPRFFSMSPREATETDPMHRLALVTAYEALEMSGFVLNSTPSTQQDRVGTFYGQTCDDWREVNAAQNIETYFIPGGVRAFAPGRINYYFGFRGPSYSVDTACSSSLAAVQIACQTLKAQECDTAVCGGVNILTAPDIFAGLSKGQFLSKTGACKTWDSEADGYCRADGVGSIILKREEDAIADKDNILGVILASGTNHSADAISITHPHAGNQATLYEKVLHTAGVDPLHVSYVEMHGTGTQAGDTNEMESVTDVFAPQNSLGRNAANALLIGAVKSNVGHGEAAAGMASLIKVLLMLRHNAIPPHIGIRNQLNPKFTSLKSRNVQIPFETTNWQRLEGRPRFAFVNNFSAAGGNTGLLLRDVSPQEAPSIADPRSVLPFVVSARSLSSLQANARQLISYLGGASDTSFSSLSYTLTARRMHHTYRIGIAASDLDTLRTSLLAKLDNGSFAPIPSKVAQVAFVFTGQGSFYPSLGRNLFESSEVFRCEILHLNERTIAQGFPSFLSAIEGSVDEEHHLSALVIQLALLCVQMALVKLWSSWDIRPTVVVGHSLGEYAALYAAGVLSKDDVIHLVGHRAKFLQERCAAGSHLMLAVMASVTEVETITGGTHYEIACINSPRETVICGNVGQMEELARDLRQAGHKCVAIDLPYAFHSKQIDPILSDFKDSARNVVFNKPNTPVISPLLSQVIKNEGSFSPEYLSRHAREPVNFNDAIWEAAKTGVLDSKTAFIEIGPHPVCTAMIKSIFETSALGVPSLHRGENPWKTLSKSLCSLYSTGLSIDWRQFHLEYNTNHELLNLPAYSFDSKNFWIDYVHDWCLYKNVPRDLQPRIDVKPHQEVSTLSTSSVHRIQSESFEANVGEVVAQSDVAHPVLRAAIMGHLVNGVGLCPSSIYADIAMTLGDYAYKQLGFDSSDTVLNCGLMEVVKPLIVEKQSTNPQILQTTLRADLTKRIANVRYASINTQGEEILLHATCVVTLESCSTWMSDWAPTTYLIHGRIDTLKARLLNDKADQISRGLAYKMFAALVQYDKNYQGMENVILDSANFEATSRINFQTEDKDGDFFCSPFWIDSLAHLSGFVLNGSDAVDSQNYVYISHGWKSMRIARTLTRTTEYRSYVKMQTGSNNVMSGDVYILEGDTVIGVVGGLKFQRIPRAMLNTLLPPTSLDGSKTSISDRSIIEGQMSRASAKDSPVRNSGGRRKLPNQRASSSQILATRYPAKDTRTSRDTATLALDVIAQETQLPLSELQDDCCFADLGVDSLLSLQISSRFREELDIDVQSSVFVDYATVGELRVKLREYDPEFADNIMTPSSPSSEDDENGVDASPPSPISSVSDSELSNFVERNSPKSEVEKETEATMKLVCDTISEQMGIDVEEVVATDDLSSLGMDSLMTIMILGTLRERTGLDLPSDLFVEYPSIAAVQEFFCQSEATKPDAKKKSQPSTKTYDKQIISKSLPQAVSVLLQGKPKIATENLFLFPDGSGSATSYANLPVIDSQIAVYGLNCPFMTTPLAFTNGIPGIASIYLAEVRRRQPRGPYHFGGWSAGGVIAYEITRQLVSAGERVETLALIDSPCPVDLEPLPDHLHHFFADIGLLGGAGQEPPSWLLPHFGATIRALDVYKPRPLKNKAFTPRTLAIWARHGVCRYPQDPRPKTTEKDSKSMRWLLENRTDFGFNGWDKLLGKDAIETVDTEGNHFTLLKDTVTLKKISKFLKDLILRSG